MRPKAGPAIGRVLQGYFRFEQFRGAGRRAAVAPPLSSGRRVLAPAPEPPRPDLLPAKMRGRVGQSKPAREAALASSGAPRPELLPGMGQVVARGRHMVAQARANDAISTTPVPAGQLRVIGDGRPLEPGIRQTMERFFQTDFSEVRVHVGHAAPAMGALAFTLGEQIHFAPGLYDPTSRDGMELLGHELTHVVQQREGRVANPYGEGVAIVQDPALEAEADRMGQWLADELWSTQRCGQPRMSGQLPRYADFIVRPSTSRLGLSAQQSAVRPGMKELFQELLQAARNGNFEHLLANAAKEKEGMDSLREELTRRLRAMIDGRTAVQRSARAQAKLPGGGRVMQRMIGDLQTCAICREDYADTPHMPTVQLTCGHQYHTACITGWAVGHPHHQCLYNDGGHLLALPPPPPPAAAAGGGLGAGHILFAALALAVALLIYLIFTEDPEDLRRAFDLMLQQNAQDMRYRR